MFTSDKKSSAKELRNRPCKTALYYTLITLFCALFAGVYEAFSYGVFSFFMIFAFAFPLALGVLPNLLVTLIDIKKYPGQTAICLWDSGVAVLTVGSLMSGVLEIYGTTSTLTIVYWIVGAVLLTAGALHTLLRQRVEL